MKVLVTGATGFIVFFVAKLLAEKGLHVKALVREGSDMSSLVSLDVEMVREDVRDLDSIRRELKDCRHNLLLERA
jgi:uncharacterized protein YbjT (DUF2867 family)